MATRPVSTRTFVVLGLVAAVAVAFFLAPRASSAPDGLEKVAAEQGIDAAAGDHALADGPLADYEVAGVEDEGLSTGLAGVLGVVLTFAIGIGGFGLMRRFGRPVEAADRPADSDDGAPVDR